MRSAAGPNNLGAMSKVVGECIIRAESFLGTVRKRAAGPVGDGLTELIAELERESAAIKAENVALECMKDELRLRTEALYERMRDFRKRLTACRKLASTR